ncbi:C-type lectin domain family 17, member A-like [Gadus chalcogrammus]|uniref:C-type lectin domain family 17, member A-like n=1 Tax=Gadus chalcogrammus TaxID=1042646 RepID=UPI0024C350AB|nr:C-type lectin domain family 17, member A-like [Gadus chalcogrammus]
MAEDVIYAMPNMMTKARYTQGEREERIVDIYASPESLRDPHQDSVGTGESSKSLGTGRSQRPDAVSPPWCPIRAVVVLLGLLSVVLLAGLLGVAVKYKTDMEQVLLTLKNLTEQRDALLCKQECPEGRSKFGCKCYWNSGWLSWNKSREFCVSHRADLVVVDSKEEMDFISGWYTTYWLGATDAAGEGTWRWVDGTVLSLDNPSWSRGGPQGGGGKNCLRKVLEQNQFKWTDVSCDTMTYGLCEQNLIK